MPSADSTALSQPAQAPNAFAHLPEPFPEPYYFEGGLRRVKPYHYTYNTFCKERWRNRELLDIFLSEFRDRTPEYYVSPDPGYYSESINPRREPPSKPAA